MSIFIRKKTNEGLILQNCKYENLDNIFKELYKRFIIPLYIPIVINFAFNFNEIKRKYKFL